jgi:nucleolar protein 14
MAGGSQLKQLKSKLKEQGLSRDNSHASKKKKRGPTQSENGSGQRQTKLAALHEEMNTFDLKFNRTKHDIGNTRPQKGRPSLSKQTAIENRRKAILPELLDRNRAGGIVDRRFGEDNPHLTPEEKALERFTKERQRLTSRKGNSFNLEDELTHYGQSLGGDDSTFGAGLGSQEDMYQAAQREPVEPDDVSTLLSLLGNSCLA